MENTEGAKKNGQSRETDNIGYARYRTKTNKAKNTTHKNKKDDQHWPHQKQEWTQVLAKSKQFLLLISHLPCYSYIQSSPVKVLAVIEERNHLRTHSYLCDYSTNRRNIWLTYIIIPLIDLYNYIIDWLI